MYNPLYSSKLGIYWEAVDDYGNEYTTNMIVTPNSLTAAIRTAYSDIPIISVARPVLKPQSLYEYAFKVGTLCSMDTEPPKWEPLMPVLARADAFIPSEIAMKAVMGVMDDYYKVGTLCKVGTPVGEVSKLMPAM
jgi:hypothetical protein